MKNYFAGYYFKHQKGADTVAFIPGFCNDHAFIQVITNNSSHNFTYPHATCLSDDISIIGGCTFSKKGILIDINQNGFCIKGNLRYSSLTPIAYDIMGGFKYLPMQCRHGIISMQHTLSGQLNFNNKVIDFTGGKGYIEKDSGISFPRSYFWIHCNDFTRQCSICASVADIPFMSRSFRGCICVVHYLGKEYRIATYLGAKIVHCGKNLLMLKQGKYCLIITIEHRNAHVLLAPQNGGMHRSIHECAAGSARFQFYIHDRKIFDMHSTNASFEYVD